MPIEYQPAQAADLFPPDAWAPAAASTEGGGGGCVEVNLARKDDDLIGVRDSKLANSPIFVFDRYEWGCFLKGAKGGEFDLN